MPQEDKDRETADPAPVPTPTNVPSVEELKDQIDPIPLDEGQEGYELNFGLAAARAERTYIHLTGLADHYRHKRKWSAGLLSLIIGAMLFQSALLIFVGIKALDFSQYQWLLPALLVQNVAQVIGLAVFVVRSLFKDMKDDV